MTAILGIDPGSYVTGYGIIQTEGDRIYYVGSGCIRVDNDSISERLKKIFHGIREVIAELQPEEVAIEQIFIHKNPNSALKLGQARGVAIVASALEGIDVFEYAARAVKQAIVGYGGASKFQIQRMVCNLLKLSGVPSEDSADALAVALCHANTKCDRLPICRGNKGIWRRKR